MAQQPFIRNEIPFTASRLKSLIKVFVSYGGYQPDPSNPNNIPQLSQLTLIGSVNKIEIKNKREAAERRELNYDTSAQILEMVPGLESFDVTFDYVMLYRANFMEACGFGGYELKNQTRPIVFALQLPSPTPSSVPYKTLLLRDCWILDNPHSFEVEAKDDLRIVQSVPIACGGILEVSG